MTPYTQAVMTSQAIYWQEGNQITSANLPKQPFVAQIFDLAHQHNLGSIWTVPNTAMNFLEDKLAMDPSGRWEIKTSLVQGRNIPTPVIRNATGKRRAGTWEDKRPITLAFPQHNSYNWTIEDAPAAVSAKACLSAIHYLNQGLGVQVHHNAGIAGRDWIARTNDTPRRAPWVVTPEMDLSQLPSKIGFDLAYMPGMDPADIDALVHGPKQMYVQAWDKNSMYIAAAESVYLGTGAPLYLSASAFQARYDALMTQYYDGKRPGYWKIQLLGPLPDFPVLYRNQEWVTTPLLKLLLTMGANLRIVEAFVWREYHRILDQFARDIWSMRQSFKLDINRYPYAPGRDLAYYSTKRIATAGVGMLANQESSQYNKQWYRPDWRAAIVEEAKARLAYKVLQIFRLYGVKPLAVATDAVYYLTESPYPAQAFPDLLDRADQLGGWKVLHSFKATEEVMHAFRAGGTAGDAARVLRKLDAKKEGVLL